jgi:hypothetical protein
VVKRKTKMAESVVKRKSKMAENVLFIKCMMHFENRINLFLAILRDLQQ